MKTKMGMIRVSTWIGVALGLYYWSACILHSSPALHVSDQPTTSLPNQPPHPDGEGGKGGGSNPLRSLSHARSSSLARTSSKGAASKGLTKALAPGAGASRGRPQRAASASASKGKGKGRDRVEAGSGDDDDDDEDEPEPEAEQSEASEDDDYEVGNEEEQEDDDDDDDDDSEAERPRSSKKRCAAASKTAGGSKQAAAGGSSGGGKPGAGKKGGWRGGARKERVMVSMHRMKKEMMEGRTKKDRIWEAAQKMIEGAEVGFFSGWGGVWVALGVGLDGC